MGRRIWYNSLCLEEQGKKESYFLALSKRNLSQKSMTTDVDANTDADLLVGTMCDGFELLI